MKSDQEWTAKHNSFTFWNLSLILTSTLKKREFDGIEECWTSKPERYLFFRYAHLLSVFWRIHCPALYLMHENSIIYFLITLLDYYGSWEKNDELEPKDVSFLTYFSLVTFFLLFLSYFSKLLESKYEGILFFFYSVSLFFVFLCGFSRIININFLF